MDEPTEEQLKQLHKDIMSGLVMIVEVEHYKRLTDNLDKSYDVNKQLQAKNIVLKKRAESAEDDLQIAEDENINLIEGQKAKIWAGS